VPQLDPTWFASQLFWLFVCFTVLYVLLSRLILPPLQGVIASRKDSIENDLNVAQELKSKAEQAKQSYESTLVKSRETAQALLAESEVASKVRAEEAIKALDAQIAVQSANANSAIAAKKQEFINELMPATIEFSSLIVEKLTRRSPSAEQVKHALESVKSSQQQG
jgi:F-type H+-transporting ATPase subunit b